MPLSLTPSQMDHLFRLAAPIEPARRPEFLAAVALELEAAGDVSEGNLHRIAARLQRSFWSPPQISPNSASPKHLARA
jgi:hypothetical protein